MFLPLALTAVAGRLRSEYDPFMRGQHLKARVATRRCSDLGNGADFAARTVMVRFHVRKAVALQGNRRICLVFGIGIQGRDRGLS
jgi:hypothetical protein